MFSGSTEIPIKNPIRKCWLDNYLEISRLLCSLLASFFKIEGVSLTDIWRVWATLLMFLFYKEKKNVVMTLFNFFQWYP